MAAPSGKGARAPEAPGCGPRPLARDLVDDVDYVEGLYVAVERCPLCNTTRRRLTCAKCVQNGDFVHFDGRDRERIRTLTEREEHKYSDDEGKDEDDEESGGEKEETEEEEKQKNESHQVEWLKDLAANLTYRDTPGRAAPTCPEGNIQWSLSPL